MQTNKTYTVILGFIFVVSLCLRLGLSLYNREANDPHMPVIRYIMKNNKLPEKMDCWECFQPKLFHYTVAKLLDIMRLNRRNDEEVQKIVAQLVNFLAGFVMMIVAGIFI